MSDNEKTKLPVNVDLSAKAEAKLEVKTEIPSESSGRLVDALTDIIRPFSEARGLRADQIRLQREDVLIEITKKTRERMMAESIQINPVPNKFLVPFLERASIEEIESEMLNRWASLLATASNSYKSTYVRYISILSELDAQQAKVFDRIITNNSENYPNFRTFIPDVEFEYNSSGVTQIIRDLGKISDEDELFEKLDCEFNCPGLALIIAAGEDRSKEDKPYWDYTIKSVYKDEDELNFAILKAHGLIEHVNTGFVDTGQWSVLLIYYYVTPLGVDFWTTCSANGHAK